MKINDLKKQLKKINDLKKNNSFNNYTLKELKKLPTFNGLCELSFKNIPFYMINISNDDAVPLKYLWRNKYEHLSLSIWYIMTRKEGYFFDVGAHTGIYSIVGNLNKKENSIISIEAYFLNFSRLLSNLKINNIIPKSSFLAAASNTEGVGKFIIKTGPLYHSSGGKISENGNLNVSKIKIDNFKLDKKIYGIKIDTEGHEFEVLEGAQNYINKDKPDIIFEINENSFDNCLELLKPYGYIFHFINEIDEKIIEIDKFSPSLKKAEGTNCFATVNQIMNYKNQL
tara:strand:- start:8098 stop:8949 length:852 start_codon:yes stop_codon:yes gene_type:complete